MIGQALVSLAILQELLFQQFNYFICLFLVINILNLVFDGVQNFIFSLLRLLILFRSRAKLGCPQVWWHVISETLFMKD